MDYLIIGNDPSVGSVDWDSVRRSKICTVGINRSHFIYPSSDMLFLQDPIIILELLDLGYTESDFRDFNILTTNYFNTRLLKDRKKGLISGVEFNVIAGYIRTNVIQLVRKFAMHTYAPFTIPNAISNLAHIDCRDLVKPGLKKYSNAQPIIFHLIGCGLHYNVRNNHFWQDTHESQSRLSGAGGSNSSQLNKQYQAFKRLLVRKNYFRTSIISVTPDSKLNNLVKYENLNTVLNRYRSRTTQ